MNRRDFAPHLEMQQEVRDLVNEFARGFRAQPGGSVVAKAEGFIANHAVHKKPTSFREAMAAELVTLKGDVENPALSVFIASIRKGLDAEQPKSGILDFLRHPAKQPAFTPGR